MPRDKLTTCITSASSSLVTDQEAVSREMCHDSRSPENDCSDGGDTDHTLHKISFPPFEALICATCSGVSISLLPLGSAKA